MFFSVFKEITEGSNTLKIELTKPSTDIDAYKNDLISIPFTI
jgi:hypothetical protein